MYPPALSTSPPHIVKDTELIDYCSSAGDKVNVFHFKRIPTSTTKDIHITTKMTHRSVAN